MYALAGVLTVAFAVLEIAFLRNDFAFNTVADTSSRTTPAVYRAAAVWSSQEGSLLLWAWLLSLWSSLALFLTRRRMRDVAAYATAILLGFGGFFVSLMVFYATPFATTSPAPVEGVGPRSAAALPDDDDPPADAVLGLHARARSRSRSASARCSRAGWMPTGSGPIRRFAFAAWLFLGVGILLGRPLVLLRARLGRLLGLGCRRERLADALADGHRVPALADDPGETRMLKVWNVSLVLATGTLAIMGTFLVRSGVLNSIHAFGGATLGVPFVALIGVLVAGSIYLVVSRRDMLRSEHRLDSLLSRESIFLANNVVLVGALLRDLLGHLLPADLRGAHRSRSLGRPAVVRPLHGSARARARAAQRRSGR